MDGLPVQITRAGVWVRVARWGIRILEKSGKALKKIETIFSGANAVPQLEGRKAGQRCV
jgi:hypothetical protein